MAPSYCGVFGCINNSKAKPHLSFFRLPTDSERRKKWIKLIDRDDIMHLKNPRQLVCAEHFRKDMLKNKRLKADAVPSLNLPRSKDLSCTSSSKENFETQVEKPEEIEQEEVSEGVVSDNYDNKLIMNVVKVEHHLDTDPLSTSISNESVATGPKLSLRDSRVQAVYESTTAVCESLRDSSVKTSSHISSRRSAASLASVAKVELDDDDCGPFAAHVRARMRNFSPGQKIIAQKLISDILFMADLKQLQVDSAVVQSQGQSVGPSDGPSAVKRS